VLIKSFYSAESHQIQNSFNNQSLFARPALIVYGLDQVIEGIGEENKRDLKDIEFCKWGPLEEIGSKGYANM
jgi:hypothetical protein